MIKKLIKEFIYRIRGEYTVDKLIKMGLTVGKNFNPQLGFELDPSHCHLIEIGDNVTFGPHVQILAHDASMYAYLGYTKIGRVRIGDNVFIGAGSIVMPNVTIGKNSVIGAGSIVTKSVPEGCVYAGNPAKIICKTSDFIMRNKKNMETCKIYDESYTLRGNVSDEKKKEQKDDLINGIGYVK